MIDVNRQGEVWVYAEQEDGALHDVVLELCGKARQLADTLKVPVGAVLPGHGVRDLAKKLVAHGADRVYVVDDARLAHFQTLPYARVVTTLVERRRRRSSCTGPRRWAETWRRGWPRRCGPG